MTESGKFKRPGAFSAKRERRRQKRQAQFGPERIILETTNGVHRLSCGHAVAVLATERPTIRLRRCAACLVQELQS